MSKHRAPEKERRVSNTWYMPSDLGRITLIKFTNDEWAVRVFGEWIDVTPECAFIIKRLTYRASGGGGTDYGINHRPIESEWKAMMFA